MTLLEVIRQNMVPLFFVYGFSFFIFGLLLIAQNKITHGTSIVLSIWLLGLFGLVHGMNEWIDGFLFHFHNFLTPNTYLMFLDIRNIFVASSFLFLLLFAGYGIRTLYKKSTYIVWLVLSASILFTLYAIVKAILLPAPSQALVTHFEIMVRYFLGFPAALFTGIVFWYWPSQLDEPSQQPQLVRQLFHAMAIVFITYAFLTGLVVPEATFWPASIINTKTFATTFGLPVQLPRTICAFLLSGFFALLIINIKKKEYVE